MEGKWEAAVREVRTQGSVWQGWGDHDGSEAFARVVLELFAVASIDTNGAIVTGDDPGGVWEVLQGFDGFGVETGEGQGRVGWGVGGGGGPGEQLGIIGGVMRTGDDEELIVQGAEAADATLLEVEEDGIAEAGGQAGQELVGILQGDEEGAAMGLGIAKADEEAAVGELGQAFDTEGSRLFWGEEGGAGDVEGGEAGILEEVVEEAGIGGADGDQAGLIGVGDEVSGEEAMAAGTGFAFAIPAVGGEPIDTGTDAGGGFDIDLGFLGVDAEERLEVQGSHGKASLVAVVKAEDLILVVGDDQVVRGEGDEGGGVASALKVGDAGWGCRECGMDEEGEGGQEDESLEARLWVR
jgi:hypothetical protein